MSFLSCKNGPSGGSQIPQTFNSYTTKPTLDTTYRYLATGYFLYAKIRRPSGLASAPAVQFYIKQDETYTAITAATTLADGVETTVVPTAFVNGDIYIKKTSGSNTTASSFNMTYLT